jgi:hypothetical protein
MQQVAQSIKTSWRNFWRVGNLSLWFYLGSFLLGFAFMFIWQGLQRIIVFSAVYYKPFRPFVAKWFWLPRDPSEMPEMKFSVWTIFSIMIQFVPVILYIGVGVWLLSKLGFYGQNFFWLFRRALGYL